MEQQAAPILIWPVIISVFIALMAVKIVSMVLWWLVVGRKMESGTDLARKFDKYIVKLGQMMGMDEKGNDVPKEQ